jgi:hypothetical protein
VPQIEGKFHGMEEDGGLGFILVMVKEDVIRERAFSATSDGDSVEELLSMEVLEHNMGRKKLLLAAIRIIEAVLRYDGVDSVATMSERPR